MKQLLRRSTVQLTGCALDEQQECPISGEYTLPEYCPDVAVVLKCFAYPRIQNRQWSGEQLLLDGNAVIRVLYLDENRRCIHSLEFTQPFSCSLRGEGRVDNAAVNLELNTKYLNCRAVSPRRIEVRGAVSVAARADCSVKKDVCVAADDAGLCLRTETLAVTVPVGVADKVMTVSESLEFDNAMPPAEMLLGGECRAYIRECKLLMGKAIVKGYVTVHQLYTDTADGEHVHCLDYVIPFSQIIDLSEAREGMPCGAVVNILSDTERCSVGPGGEQTILDVSVKLLVQVQVYETDEFTVLNDAYHNQYPVTAQTEELTLSSLVDTRWEMTTLPMKIAVPADRWGEVLDVIVSPQECKTECREGMAVTKGRLAVCILARDADGEVLCEEFIEEYGFEHPCQGNEASVSLTVAEVKYHSSADALVLQATLCVALSDYLCCRHRCIADLHLCKETPYPKQKVTAWLYYADKGESVWDIGRVCHTDSACILSENNLGDEIVDKRQLILIPVIH